MWARSQICLRILSFLNREEGHNVLEVYFADGFELLSGPKIRGLGNGEGG